jgi:hypothetical protein
MRVTSVLKRISRLVLAIVVLPVLGDATEAFYGITIDERPRAEAVASTPSSAPP